MSDNIAETHSLFEQPWWLDATAPGAWDAVTVEEEGRVVARLPFVVRRKYGLLFLGQPPLTQTLGPWIESVETTESDRLAREKDLMSKLIRQLPRHDRFHQNFHPNVSNWLPFFWSGFTQTTRYTYTIDDLTDLDKVFRNISGSSRKVIRRAERQISVSASADVGEVARMARLTFERQGLQLPYPEELLYRIDEASNTNADRRILVSTDDTGRTHSALLVVGDRRRMYSLVSGIDPALRTSGSGQLMRWRAIQSVASSTQVYDFEGSMIEGIEEFYRKFGAKQTPYHSVSRSSGLVSRAFALRRVLTG